MTVSQPEHLDVLVVGAGISGIDAGYHLSRDRSRTFAILEGRAELGGTWSLFQYPGIRSDSEMYTLGFPFRPWTSKNSIAEGSEILEYVKETAHEFGLDKRIRYNHQVIAADWSSEKARWTVQVRNPITSAVTQLSANFLFFTSGYYAYNEGYYPTLPGADTFKGPIVQPQFWPKDLDYAGKKVVVIGSGATAVTLLPSMANRGAKHVTMLQRSPSYFVSQPKQDPIARFVRFLLPVVVAHHYLRIRNQVRQTLLVLLSTYCPSLVRWGLRKMTKRQLPTGYPLDPHFNPSYNPWEQRLCMVPDGDFFTAIRAGHASVATGHIDTILPHAIRLQDGQEIEADVIVQATGLKVELLGGTKVTLDGKPGAINERYIYKGQMLDGVPNVSMAFGYTNASWTLGADLCSRYVVRLLDYMKQNGYAVARPHCDQSTLQPAPLMNLTSGYVQRAKDAFPKSSTSWPWQSRQNSFTDWLSFPFDKVHQDIEFAKSAPAALTSKAAATSS